jgi:hypothetical protein
MRTILYHFLLTLSMMIFPLGCGRSNPVSSEISDEEAINLLISTSGYADFSNYGDDGITQFPGATAKNDSFPDSIFFCRRIECRSCKVNISYDSSGSFATAQIVTRFRGRFVVDNNRNGLCDTISRTIDDCGLRYVWFKKRNSRWKIYGASPMVVLSNGADNQVIIDSMKIEADLGLRTNVIYRNHEFEQTMEREDMPILYPGTNVSATVWTSLGQASDSCWIFMHRRIWQEGVINHIKTPMVRDGCWEFRYSWVVDGTDEPVVRHVAADVLLGSTIFGDGGEEYSACLWTVPYIVTVNDSLP